MFAAVSFLIRTALRMPQRAVVDEVAKLLAETPLKANASEPARLPAASAARVAEPA